MRRSDRLMLLPFAVVVILFAAGVVQLFALRFRQGDIYPPYSSLRADPLGTKGLYEALSAMPQLEVGRNVRQFDKLEGQPGLTLLHLGLDANQDVRLPEDELYQLGALAVGGTRVVLGFLPVMSASGFEPFLGRLPKPPPPPKGMPNDFYFSSRPWSELLEEWDVRMEYQSPQVDRASRKVIPLEAELDPDYADTGISPTLMVRTGVYFVPAVGSDWKTVYQIEGRAVVLEKKRGRGSVVLMAEAYPLSNEALHAERQTGLVGWLLGNSSRVVFEETHLGIEQRPGLMNLARKYGLHGAFASLGLLAVLFIWSATVPVVPRHAEEEESERIARSQARDSFSGMVNLLRRGIRPQDLINVCLAQWKRTLRGGVTSGMLTRIQKAEAAARLSHDAGRLRTNPAESYREISEILNRRGGNP